MNKICKKNKMLITNGKIITLERIISNCWNNSIEATSNQFVKLGIHVSQGGNSMTISMTDNGPGFPETFFRNLDEGIILTTKPTGNGIGLNYAISSLRDEDAKLQFNNLLNGAEVRIVFSDRNISKKDDPVVLIDDDKYVRYSWAVNAEKLGINIHSFSSIEDFQDRSSEYDSNTEIFIDSDLGRDKRGEDYIKHLFNLGFHRLNIQTGSEPCDFQDITHLNSIVSKTFPY